MTCDGQIVRREPHGTAGFERSVLTIPRGAGLRRRTKFLGVDDNGREVVSFIPGAVLDKGALVRHARASLADEGLVESVEHFERLLAWLEAHDGALKSAASRSTRSISTAGRDRG